MGTPMKIVHPNTDKVYLCNVSYALCILLRLTQCNVFCTKQPPVELDKDRHNRDLYLMSTTPVQIKKKC
jgi:hypothetical protein